MGEIWLSGPSKAQGYWGRPELTQEAFKAKLGGDGQTEEYLRTGDLGFLHEGQVYICGRLKDLIIVQGRNYYPQDIEGTLCAAHAAVRPGCTAAVCLEVCGEDKLVVLAELRQNNSDNATCTEVLKAIQYTVSSEHGLEPWAILLLKERTICKTTSGKIRRRACKADVNEWLASRHLENDESGLCCARDQQNHANTEISIIYSWMSDGDASSATSATGEASAEVQSENDDNYSFQFVSIEQAAQITAHEISQIIGYEITKDEDLSGMSSLQAVQISERLTKVLLCHIMHITSHHITPHHIPQPSIAI